jgi:ABC-2 type transport system ATP-binding protein
VSDREPAIIVKDVKKRFTIPLDKSSGIKQRLVNFYKHQKGHRTFKALDGVSFEVKKGEFFGIVGRNGSGKSTLLKILAGVYSPDAGGVAINGSLTPFIELGVGFNPELSGRDNVFLNGALLGFSKSEMEEMYGDIVDFAELHDFMEERLKNYSSGMQVRLAFSIAIRAETDILILDEVLAVGDEAFQKKCNDYFQELKKKQKTVILVTHSMEAVNRFCDRALLLEKGLVKAIGSPKEVSSQYSLDNLRPMNLPKGNNMHLSEAVKTLDVVPLSPTRLTNDDDFEFEIKYELNQDIEVDLGISIMRQGKSVIEHNTTKLKIGSKKDTPYAIRYRLPLDIFVAGPLDVDAAIFGRKEFDLIGFNTNACSFMVESETGITEGGVINKRGEWLQG